MVVEEEAVFSRESITKEDLPNAHQEKEEEDAVGN